MQNQNFQIRDAHPEDAVASTLVLRESISQLCDADHNNDPDEVSGWLANKTTDTFLKWLEEPYIVMRVAARENKIFGVASCNVALRKVVLLYVAPEHRFSGVSAALLTDLEEILISHGTGQIRLESTVTALSFYKSRGWQLIGEEGSCALLVKQK